MFNKISSEWQTDNFKRAPKNVITKDHEVQLIFDDKILVLHKNNAKPLRQFDTKSFDQNIVDLNSEIISTNKGVFSITKDTIMKLKSPDDDYYKIVSTNRNYFIFGKEGIYKIEGDEVTKQLKHSFVKSKNIERINSYYVCADENNLIFYNTYFNELEKLNFPGLRIKDFKVFDSEIAILTERSLLYIDKIEAVERNIKISKIIPLFDLCMNSKILFANDKQLIFSCNDQLLSYDLSSNNKFPLPLLKASSIKDNKMIKFKTNNHWTDEINYSYLVRSEKNSTSYWSRDNKIEVNRFAPNTSIDAKMKDNIFGMPIFAKQIHTPQKTHSSTNLGHFILIGIFSISCLFLWRFLNR